MVDDILDATANSTVLGKTAGKDAAQDKPTYVSILGLEASQALAQTLRQQAHDALQELNNDTDFYTDSNNNNAPQNRTQRLAQLADFIVQRVA